MPSYGYARCSTDEERQDIDRQKRELRALGVESDDHIYYEYKSGAVKDRPELRKLLEVVRPGDTIVTTEVSRLTRSIQQLCDILQTVQDQRLRLIIGSAFSADCRKEKLDPMTKTTIMICGVFAEFERDMISERVRSGMENARAKGKTIGRPAKTADDLPAKFWRAYALHKDGKITVTDMAGMLGLSRATIYKYIRIAENDPGEKGKKE